MVPWEGYLVPQNSTGSPGADTLVALKANVTATNVVSYQVDIYFDTGIVNITAVNFTGSPFTTNSLHHYGDHIRVGGISFGSTGIPTGTHTLCTLTFTGKSEGASDITFTRSSVIDPDGGPITNTYTNGTYTGAAQPQIFDTGAPITPYPSIAGVHNGTITPNKNISVNYLYTYPCTGTGGHTEFAMIWNETTGDCAVADWHGYQGDYHNISFNTTLPLKEGVVYSYTIRTGSYPRIHHTDKLQAKEGMGIINCTSFVDANGRSYNNWIPAIILWA